MTMTISAEQTVRVGSRVRVLDFDGEEEYVIVGHEDADAARGLISMASPLGQALLGRCAGDQVKVRAPGGQRAVTILGIF